MNRERAFVAGATGATGRLVVEKLVERGIETYAHVRQDHTDLDEWLAWFRTLGAEIDLTAFEQVDISNTLARLKPSLVFCLLGSNPARMGKRGSHGFNPFIDGYDAVDNGLSTMMMRAASSSGSNPRFILASAYGADENSRVPMLSAKGRAESFLQASRLRYTGIRIATLLGTPVEERRRGSWDRLMASFGLADESRDITPNQAADLLVEIAIDPASIEVMYDPEEYLESVPQV